MLFSAENKCCARGFELLLLIFGQKIITPLRLAGQISQLQRGMEEYRPGVAGWCRVGDGEGGGGKMVQYGAIWCKMVQDCAGWCKVVQGGARWCKMVQVSARWCKLVQDSAR